MFLGTLNQFIIGTSAKPFTINSGSFQGKEPSEKSCIFSRLLVTAPFALEPIEVKTCSATQKDHLNLSFVKGVYIASKNLVQNGQKTAIYCFNRTQQSDEEIQMLIN